MSGLLSIQVEEARGFVAASADLDRLAVVMGCSSEGEGLSPFFLSGASAIADRGYGDAVDALTQVIEQRQESGSAVKFPAAMYTVPDDTAGSYGEVDDSGITGLGTVTAGATEPFGTYQVRIRWMTPTIVGTGGTYQWSLDDGRNWSRTTSLVGTSIVIPNSGVELELSPSAIDLAALDTLLNEEKADHNAHIALTAGGVHGAADVTNVVTAAAASNTATRVALANDLRAKHEAHRILTAGGVHGAADATNVITVPVATDDSSALALALEIKAKRNAHIALIAGAVHGAADATNPTTAADPAAGTFNAGDEVAVPTYAPVPAADDVDDAFIALANASIDFSLLILEFPCDSAMLAHVTTGLNALLARGKRVTVLCRARLPDLETDETEVEWGEAIAADVVDFTDSRIHRRETFCLVTDAVTTRQYLRSDLAQFAADAVRVGRFGWPCAPADRPTPNVTLVDADGATVGHDEGPRGVFSGLSNETLGNRGGCQQRLADPTRREDVFNTVPWVLYANDERIRNLMVRRLMNAMARVAVAAATPKLGSLQFYKSTGAGTGVLTAASRNSLQGTVYQALRAEFASEIDNANDAAIDSGLVQVDAAVTVSGGNLLGTSITIAPRVGGFVISETLTLAPEQ